MSTLAAKIAAREQKTVKAVSQESKFRADTCAAVYIAAYAYAAGVSNFIKTAPQSGYSIGAISASASAVARYCRKLEEFQLHESLHDEDIDVINATIAYHLAKQDSARRAALVALRMLSKHDAKRLSAHEIIFIEDYRE